MIVTGTGLVALDYLVNENSIKKSELYLGGSCGNVLTLLSYLGNKSYPIARLNNNLATKILLDECSKWDIRKDFIFKSNDGNTPIIVQKNYLSKDGTFKHKFEFKCPVCNSWLPRYKAVLAKQTKSIIEHHSYTDVFYFDKVSRGALNLANHYKQKGGVVFFEPSSIKKTKQFDEAIQIADIIKFSEDRINNYSSKFPKPQAFLEVITLGKDGLKYRTISNNNWKYLPAKKIKKVYDSSGAGDFCSAGIIQTLGKEKFEAVFLESLPKIERALHFGQTLGAINCFFKGARGAMYYLTKDELDFRIEAALLNKDTLDIDIFYEKKVRKSINEGCIIC